jgi:hypothetical protein
MKPVIYFYAVIMLISSILVKKAWYYYWYHTAKFAMTRTDERVMRKGRCYTL